MTHSTNHTPAPITLSCTISNFQTLVNNLSYDFNLVPEHSLDSLVLTENWHLWGHLPCKLQPFQIQAVFSLLPHFTRDQELAWVLFLVPHNLLRQKYQHFINLPRSQVTFLLFSMVISLSSLYPISPRTQNTVDHDTKSTSNKIKNGSVGLHQKWKTPVLQRDSLRQCNDNPWSKKKLRLW